MRWQGCRSPSLSPLFRIACLSGFVVRVVERVTAWWIGESVCERLQCAEGGAGRSGSPAAAVRLPWKGRESPTGMHAGDSDPTKRYLIQ